MLPDDVLPFSMFIALYTMLQKHINVTKSNLVWRYIERYTQYYTPQTITIYRMQLIQLKNIKLKAFCIQHSLNKSKLACLQVWYNSFFFYRKLCVYVREILLVVVMVMKLIGFALKPLPQYNICINIILMVHTGWNACGK